MSELKGTYNKDYYEKNRERIIKNSRNYIEKNKEELLQKRKEYYQKNKEQILEKTLNSPKRKEYAARYYELNKERIRIKQAEARLKKGIKPRVKKEPSEIITKPIKTKVKNNLTIQEYRKQYYQNNKEKLQQQIYKAQEKHIYAVSTDILYEIRLSKGKGKPTNNLQKFFIKLVNEFSRKFYDKVIIEDQKQEALLVLLEKWNCFNELNCKNPLSYYTEITKRAFTKEYNKQYSINNSNSQTSVRDFEYVSINNIFL